MDEPHKKFFHTTALLLTMILYTDLSFYEKIPLLYADYRIADVATINVYELQQQNNKNSYERRQNTIILVTTLRSRGRALTSSRNHINHSCFYNVA